MSRRDVRPIGRERFFGDEEIIVSKTDPKGVITSANEVFVGVSGYSEAELLGAAHSIIRHPDMPRCVFQHLWDTLHAGREISAYVMNLAQTGQHCWVLAHVTPTLVPDGRAVGYHSCRRVPSRPVVEQVRPVYQRLLQEEAKYPRSLEGIAAGTRLLGETLAGAGVSYDEFVWSLEAQSVGR
jgi:PAS domain S-box-containing protein